MDRNEKLKRLRAMLKQIAPDQVVESLAPEQPRRGGGLESMGVARVDEEMERARSGVQKIAQDVPNNAVDDREIQALEAIVLPQGRPVVFIQNGTFQTPPDPWSHFANDDIRRRIEAAIPSIGRIELPTNLSIPYGGTGFVVGEGLLMTNRHVAELFASGLGLRGLSFRTGQSAGCDFKQEFGSTESQFVTVREIVMIHPFWDMAVLRVEGLPAGHEPLRLSVAAPEELLNREVAVIGYPAKDWRNDSDLQDRIFAKTYNVKRLHPGKVRPRQNILSFANDVNAITHDSSTLGGNSGSAMIDVATGEIVGLHFAGVYLKANYAVPTFELARDKRVVDAGLNFTRAVSPTGDWAAAWRMADADERPAPHGAGSASTQSATRPPTPASAPLVAGTGAATWMIPLHVSVTLGTPSGSGTPAIAGPSGATAGAADVGVEALQEPFIAGDLVARRGYQPGFLRLGGGEEVPLPVLTAKGKKMAAKLDNGSTELKYHKFSIVMHKERRLALFTVANVDWRKASRLIDGKKPTRRELTGLGDFAIEKWVTDPRIPEDHQLPDLFFTRDDGAWDKGHLVRRDDVCWGSSLNDIRMANGDTYHTTNCSPQTLAFNRSAKGEDNWGDLENLVQKQSGSETLITFSGPVLADDDPVFVGRDDHGEVRVQIPRKFWKIIVAKGAGGAEAYGFVLEQDLSRTELEFAVPADWKPYMEKISTIEAMLNGLARLTWLKKHDQFGTAHGESVVESVGGSGTPGAESVADAPSGADIRANVETAGPLAGANTAEGFIQGATFQNRQVTFAVLGERAIFEGDIDLGSLADLSATPDAGLESIGVTGAQFRWPKGKIPFTIAPSLPDQKRVTDAIAHWETKTKIRFVKRTNETDFVTFEPGAGCSSSVGRRGGQQFVSLGPACTTGNAIHEIGHTVGLWHEQSREDRDRFVTIDFTNIQGGMEHNFLQHIADGDDLGKYDYSSIMHYPANAFAKNPAKPTIRTPQGEPIGQRMELSPGDIAGVAAMYPKSSP